MRTFHTVPTYVSNRYIFCQADKETRIGQNFDKVMPATMPVTSVAPPIIPAVEACSGATVLKIE